MNRLDLLAALARHKARLEKKQVCITKHRGERIVHARPQLDHVAAQRRIPLTFQREPLRALRTAYGFHAPQRFARNKNQSFRPAVPSRYHKDVRMASTEKEGFLLVLDNTGDNSGRGLQMGENRRWLRVLNRTNDHQLMPRGASPVPHAACDHRDLGNVALRLPACHHAARKFGVVRHDQDAGVVQERPPLVSAPQGWSFSPSSITESSRFVLIPRLTAASTFFARLACSTRPWK